jgi:hypothetical protein
MEYRSPWNGQKIVWLPFDGSHMVTKSEFNPSTMTKIRINRLMVIELCYCLMPMGFNCCSLMVTKTILITIV